MRTYLCFLAILTLLWLPIFFGPPRVYSIALANQQELPSNERIKAGITDLKAYVKSQAIAYGINPTLALWIVQHESSFDPTRKGDDGQSRGLWQISSIYHPEVSNECAFDPSCSTRWSLAWIAKGNVMQWSSRRFCREWYPDCPF